MLLRAIVAEESVEELWLYVSQSGGEGDVGERAQDREVEVNTGTKAVASLGTSATRWLGDRRIVTKAMWLRSKPRCWSHS